MSLMFRHKVVLFNCWVTAIEWVLDTHCVGDICKFQLVRSILNMPIPILFLQEVLGVVEVMIRGRSRTERDPGTGTMSMIQTAIRLGVRTRKTLVAQRMRPMMTAGPLSAAELRPLQKQIYSHLPVSHGGWMTTSSCNSYLLHLWIKRVDQSLTWNCPLS